MTKYNLLIIKAKLYIEYLLTQGAEFNVKCCIGHVEVTLAAGMRVDAPLTEWQATVLGGDARWFGGAR